METIFEKLTKEFEAIISTKTGWGKNEIMKVYNECLVKALSEYIIEKQTTTTKEII